MTVWQRLICILVAFGWSAAALAGQDNLPFSGPEACMQGPLAEFGRYIGDWRIEDSTLAQDGSGWGPGNGARWIFSCLGEGTAIQDFWMTPDGNVGTNLRSYDPEAGTWEIAWAVNGAPGFAHIRAVLQDDDTIVMRYVSELTGPDRRITFYPPDDTGWKWKLELSSDGGENWLEVYRIRAVPYESRQQTSD